MSSPSPSISKDLWIDFHCLYEWSTIHNGYLVLLYDEPNFEVMQRTTFLLRRALREMGYAIQQTKLVLNNDGVERQELHTNIPEAVFEEMKDVWNEHMNETYIREYIGSSDSDSDSDSSDSTESNEDPSVDTDDRTISDDESMNPYGCNCHY